MGKTATKRTDAEPADQLHGIERHVRIRQAAEVSGLTESYWRKLCMLRKIKFKKAGTATLIPISEVKRLLE